MRHKRNLASVIVVIASAALHAQQPNAAARSPRNANYSIDVRLDPAARTLTATEIIRWRNIATAPADSLRVHLYWNAWQNDNSTFMRERALAGTDDSDVADRDRSFVKISSFTLANADGTPGQDLLPGVGFVQPDDGNRDDQTLAAVALPAPVPPNGELTLRVQWTARVPRTFARTGAIGNYYFIAQWFPKLGVFEDNGWTAHQFHSATEFFSDYGRYDVRMTVPRGWIVGATGTEQSRTDNADGTTTHRYVQDDVHDFAWTTSPDYLERRQRFTHPSLPGVEMRLLLQPEHVGQEERHFAATAAALRYYGEWYGAYPYDHITIVDPAYQSDAGGMEYPTLFTAGTQLFAPRHSNSPEGVTIHEAGHQFWYGIVGSNETENAWMDEGFNQFSEARVAAVAFRPDYYVQYFFGGFIPWQYRDIALARETDGNLLNDYRRAAESDPEDKPTFRYHPRTHWWITYAKTALWLNTLERHLGWETLQRIMSTHFARWQFRHPKPQDFFAIVNEASGRDMTWFFDQVYRSSNEFDYGIETFSTKEHADTAIDGSSKTFESVVVVRRHGEAIFPVDVLITFENGEQVREKWDGVDRWTAFRYLRPVRARVAQVDPERVLLLDVNYTNNSRTTEPKAAEAATKWSLKWMVWLQDLMLTWSFIV